MRNLKIIYQVVVLLMVIKTNGSVWARGGGHSHGHSHGSIGIGYYGSGFYGGYGYGGYGFGGYGYGYPYFYPRPFAYPQTVIVPIYHPVYIQQPQAQQAQQAQPKASYWYYCQNPDGYYPYVKNCPDGWLQVAPQPPVQ